MGLEPVSATIAATLQQAGATLRAAQVPNDLLDAQTLLAFALSQDRTYLIVNFNQQLSAEVQAQYQALIARRATGEPLQYITGRQEFFGLEFEVTTDVLIPRPETELIVEETLRLAQQHDLTAPVIMDVGTGSGCIAIALARELSAAHVIASDISPAALRVARRNAARHGLAARVDFIAADLLDAFTNAAGADFILSNPPYVTAHELASLQREVRDWEPHVALTDAHDGLSFYRRLLRDAPARLKAGGYLLCELGYTQAAAVTALVDQQTWSAPRLLDDLQGIPRTLVLCKR